MSKRRTKKNFYRDDVLKHIVKIFIRPVIESKPKAINLNDWLDHVFCVDTRSIDRYEVTKDIKLNGSKAVTATTFVEGTGYRNFRKGQELYIRHDTTMPNVYDVEVTGLQGKQNEIYRLTKLQYKLLEKSIKPKPFKTRKRKRYSWDR